MPEAGRTEATEATGRDPETRRRAEKNDACGAPLRGAVARTVVSSVRSS